MRNYLSRQPTNGFETSEEMSPDFNISQNRGHHVAKTKKDMCPELISKNLLKKKCVLNPVRPIRIV